MASSLKLVLLLTSILAGCASHQMTEKSVTPNPVVPFQAMQVQVNFAIPAHSDYLADQLVMELGKYGIRASVLNTGSRPGPPKANAGVLQLTLTGSWTETFISHRQKTRRSLTQMRGRIPRESPRFRSDLVLRDGQTGQTVWQMEVVTEGAWYADFNTLARSLAKKLVRQLSQQGLIAPNPEPAPS